MENTSCIILVTHVFSFLTPPRDFLAFKYIPLYMSDLNEILGVRALKFSLSNKTYEHNDATDAMAGTIHEILSFIRMISIHAF